MRPGWSGSLLVVAGLVAVLGGVGLTAGLQGSSVATVAVPSPVAIGAIPAEYLSWFEQASTTCPGLSWTVLAGIGHVESSDGTSSLPGVHSGANFAGAEGPMQFEPATFAEYATVGPGGANPPSPYDPIDAIWSAARMLCDDGAAQPGGLQGAIFAYNHSAAYVDQVLATASSYAVAGATAAPGGIASLVISAAESYVGTPYVWGGERPGVGFDCSGLVQWVFAEAGVDLPRVAQAQYDATAHLGPGAVLVPGDLVFFGASTQAIDHVGIYVGNGEMVDAPHTGAFVRIEPMPRFTPAFVAASLPALATAS